VEAERLHVTTLENGLRVMVLEDHRLPQVSLGLAVRRGAASEPIAQAGLASFLADLMARGAGERDALALAEAVDGLGASFGVSADWDSIEVGVSGLSRDLAPLFGVLADLALRPRLDPAEAEKVRAETLAELERAKDRPQTLASWHFSRAVYDGHRYGLPAEGTPETVARLDAAAARAFHDRLFVPGNAILYASGAVVGAEIQALAREAFGAWPAAPVPDPGPPPPARVPAARKIVVVDRPDLGQAQILLGHEGIERTYEERVAVSLLNNVLGGGGFSSRLMQVVREREGLAYGVGSSFRMSRAAGPFVVGTATRVAETRRALDLVLGELAAIRERPPDADELAHAQTYAAGRFALGLETSDAMLASLVDLDVYGLPLDGLDTYRARVAAVTTADVAREAAARIHPERAAIVVVGPARELEPALAGLGPVEVVAP
jgi:zinc protease